MLAVEKRFLKFGHLDDNISASNDDISVIMTILVLLIALILGRLNQFPRFHFQQLVEGSSTLPCTRFLISLLITA